MTSSTGLIEVVVFCVAGAGIYHTIIIGRHSVGALCRVGVTTGQTYQKVTRRI